MKCKWKQANILSYTTEQSFYDITWRDLRPPPKRKAHKLFYHSTLFTKIWECLKICLQWDAAHKYTKNSERQPTDVRSVSSFHIPLNMKESNRCLMPLWKQATVVSWIFCNQEMSCQSSAPHIKHEETYLITETGERLKEMIKEENFVLVSKCLDNYMTVIQNFLCFFSIRKKRFSR